MLSARFVFPTLQNLADDLPLIAEDTPLDMADTMDQVGETVRDEARAGFIRYAASKRGALVSAEGIRSGVVTWAAGSAVSVGQTLPRSANPIQRRPQWAELQLRYGLFPARQQSLTPTVNLLSRGIERTLKRHGFR